MGITLRDALKNALQKAQNSSLEEKKRQLQSKGEKGNLPLNDSSSKRIPPEPQPVNDHEQLFHKKMKGLGVKAASFENTRFTGSPTVGKQNEIPATAPSQLPDKRAVNFQQETNKNTIQPVVVKQPEKKIESKSVNQQPAKPKTTNPEQTPKAKPTILSPRRPEPYRIRAKGKITANPFLKMLPSMSNPLVPENDGIEEQLCNTRYDDEREVVMGLDFGTACVKVVIGDTALGKAFAVPFSTDIGLAAYLLPSRVWLSVDRYTLSEQGIPKRNLKLSLIDHACSTECFAAAIAFLALVIRRSRGWLFSQHLDIYKRTRILWKLTLGLPAATYENQEMVERFKKLAASAWLVAGIQENEIPRNFVELVSKEANANEFTIFRKKPEIKHVDFDVVPELSAQIYGFLTSTKFDTKARNIFMMVDVGAGTVDSSVFYVTRGRGKKLQFNFYSNIVEFNGVANLHVMRLSWFKKVFKEIETLKPVVADIESLETSTDSLQGIPDSLVGYFKGLEISFNTQKDNPDAFFYQYRLKNQVLAKTLHGARNCVESEYSFHSMPVFICGGGSRMKFYRKLEEDILHHPNASWFRFRPQQLEVPNILSAPGVNKNDFDRLSVAFGLSFLNAGEYIRETIKPRATRPVEVDPRRCTGCGAIGTCYCD